MQINNHNIQPRSRTIRILPEFIANQIAAGEVVQRPESVIKELVENSFDAGADSVLVLVKDAGKQLIQVIDNGYGMSKEDLILSITRHATSKIFTSEDLETIKTFGFRGEALASISAVANIEIRSKRAEDDHGWKLVSEPMKDPEIEPIQMDNGTQIYVRNLFYNVPARRKFLKSNLTEFRYLSDTLIKFVLGNSGKRLTFYDNDTLVFDIQPGELIDRIEAILGKNTSSSVMKLDFERDRIRISGYVGKPHIAKQSRSGQYLFLNGRSIINKSLSYAVFSAFEHLLEKSANPVFIINIELDPREYDVNVHPQKHEVKFEDERKIFSAILKAVSNALSENNLAPAFNLNKAELASPFTKVNVTGTQQESQTLFVNRLTGEIIDSEPEKRPGFIQTSFRNEDDYRPRNFQPVISAFDEVFGKNEQNENQTEGRDIQTFLDDMSVKSFWQLHRKYIFIQTINGCKVIDQHAAHERIIYEKALRMMNVQLTNSQEVLFPFEVKLTPSEMSSLIETKDELKLIGYSIETEEPDTAIISAVPLDVAGQNETGTFREILDTFAEYQKIRTTNKRDNLAASFACKAAIKTGQPLSQEEMKKLFDDLMLCEVPFACPHGRPIVLEMSLNDFDKKFGRLL
jgi:DNA mismatch repair protein MutL